VVAADGTEPTAGAPAVDVTLEPGAAVEPPDGDVAAAAPDRQPLPATQVRNAVEAGEVVADSGDEPAIEPAPTADAASGRDLDQPDALPPETDPVAAPLPDPAPPAAAAVAAPAQPQPGAPDAPGADATPTSDEVAALPVGRGEAPKPALRIVPDKAEPQAKAPARGEPPAAVPQAAPRRDGELQTEHEGWSRELPRAAAEHTKTAEPEAPAHRQGEPAGAPKVAPEGAPKAAPEIGQNFSAAGASNTGPQASLHAQAVNTPAAAVSQAPAHPASPAVPMAGLAVEIATQAHDGKRQFEIRLDPPELGRIDVRLEVDRDGHAKSRLIADRTATLDLLRREAPQLERALAQAGLKMSDNALEFALRQHAFAREEAPPQHAARVIVPADDPAPIEAMRQGYGRLLGLGGGLDIRV
jgi:hypothetical protein